VTVDGTESRSFGILMVGFVMLKGVFTTTTAYLALLTGILGIVSQRA